MKKKRKNSKKKVVAEKKVRKQTTKQSSQKKDPEENLTASLDLGKNLDIIKLFRNFKDEEIKICLQKYLHNLVVSSKLNDKYKIIFLYDSIGSIMDYDLNKIHRSLLKKKGDQDVLIIIHSNGGSIEPAYLISKTCKESANDKFVVVIPRKAKSAATLLALGADEIHMGPISQLGPIDPQIGGRPVLALGNAVEYLAKITKRYPESSKMFALYLSYDLDLKQLGYFERISESAAQYAERLLADKKLPNKQTSKEIAEKFAFSFKDHGFVIDKKESEEYLGEHIKTGTPELELGEQLFNWIDNVDTYLGFIKNQYLIISGDCMEGGFIVGKNLKNS